MLQKVVRGAVKMVVNSGALDSVFQKGAESAADAQARVIEFGKALSLIHDYRLAKVPGTSKDFREFARVYLNDRLCDVIRANPVDFPEMMNQAIGLLKVCATERPESWTSAILSFEAIGESAVAGRIKPFGQAVGDSALRIGRAVREAVENDYQVARDWADLSRHDSKN